MITFFTYLFLLAGVQGILLSIFLITKKNNHSANIVLAAGVAALSLDLFQAVYYMNEWYIVYPHLMGITYAFAFLFGPIFYLYAKIISEGDNSFHKNYYYHFIPFILVLLYTVPVLLSGGEEKIIFLNRMIGGYPSVDYIIIDDLKPLYGIFYTVLTIRITSYYNKKIKDSFSNIDKINLNWLRNLAAAMVIIWFLIFATSIFDMVLKNSFNFAVPVAISILIYSIGYMGLKQPEVFNQVKEMK